jgi:hypothetical protein
MDHETRLRLIEMYTNLLNYTYMNYIQTNATIQQIEGGIRELIRQNGYDMRAPNYNNTRQYDDGRSHPPLWSNRSNLYNPVSSRMFGGTSAGGAGPRANAGAGAGANVRTNANPGANPGAGAGANQNDNNRGNRTVRTRQNSYRSSTHDLYTPIFTAMFNVDNLTPVVVRPTASHIETATERITFDENMVHTTCPITQSPFQSSDRIMRIRHCGHCFMEEGLTAWFRQSVRCPVCRYDIRISSQAPNIDASANATANATAIATANVTANATGNANANANAPANTTRNVNQNSNDISSNFINTNINTNTNTTNITNSQSIDNLLSLFTTQISDTFRQYLANSDGSNNALDNGIIDVEYIIHPPTNLYTTQARTARLFGDVDSNRTSNDNNNDNNNTETDYNDNTETDYNDNTETDYNDNSDSDTDPDN